MHSSPRIPVRSRRQALDWSLVLASQGIETWIDDDPGQGFGLLVSGADLDRAQAAIQAYRLENRRFRWRQNLSDSEFVFDWSSLSWVFLIGFFHLLDTQTDLHTAGLMSSRLVSGGDWWRLFTAIWLHADTGHLAANATLGVVLMGLAMGIYGTGLGLLLACLAGVGGNVLVLLAGGSGHQSLGASGAVMGALGLLAATPALLELNWLRQPKYLISGLLGGSLLFVLLGASEKSDVLAHAGGFITGLGLGLLAAVRPGWLKSLRAQVFAGVATALLVIIPWAVALKVFGLVKS